MFSTAGAAAVQTEYAIPTIDKRMVTRHNRPDYFLLNDGPNNKALPEDRIPETA
jgi:hypothetical protein